MLISNSVFRQSYYSALLVPFAMMMVVSGSACSSRELYTAAQDNQRQHCLRLPPAEQNACMEGLGESYDSYKRQREEVTDK